MASIPSLIPTCETAATDAFITSVGLHPIEPLQAIGLSSGEVCLYKANTDALSWIIEMDAARQAQRRQSRWSEAATTTTPTTAAAAAAAGGGGGTSPPVTLAALPCPVKVFSIAAVCGGRCTIAHTAFLKGREEDLVREVVQPRLHTSATTVSAKHLLCIITGRSDVLVVDVTTAVLVLHWASAAPTGGGRGTAAAVPLSSTYVVTQAETYGALLYLTVARRSAVAVSGDVAEQQQRRLYSAGVVGGPERNIHQQLNEPVVYVLHLGCTQPLAPCTTKGLAAGGGAYVIKAAPAAAARKARKHHDGLSVPSAAAAGGDEAAAAALSIRAHPFAPLLLLLLNQAEVQVYAIDSGGGDGAAAAARPRKAQLIFASAPAATPLPLLDAQFIPSAAVLSRRRGGGTHAPAPTSASHAWGCCNVQILLHTATRLRLLCTRSAAATAGGSGGVVAVDRAFYAAPSPPSSSSSSCASGPHLMVFQRVWTWLGSPDTVFVLQSDRTVVELCCNDAMAASTGVPSVRSRRCWAPRAAWRQARGAAPADAVDWWVLPPLAAAVTASGVQSGVAGPPCVQWPDVLPLWGGAAGLSGGLASRLPAHHAEEPQSFIFSRRTGLARPLPARAPGEEAEAEAEADADGDDLHVVPLAETEVVGACCISVRLCLTPRSQKQQQQPLPPSPLQKSVNVSVARLLCDSPAPALLRLEHGFYFVGSRTESAYADYPFMVAGLLLRDGAAHLRVAMLCLPADKAALRRLYDAAAAAAAAEAAPPSGDLKRALQHAVRHTQLQPLPMPLFSFEARPSSAARSKRLVSCDFQLGNDGVVPCVWGLWAPLPATSAPDGAAAAAAAPQPVQLTMQSYHVAADTHELRWRPPELVRMDDLLTSNPSQVFAVSSVLSGAAASQPPTSMDDVLLDTDSAVVARLFLYYADRKVLLLATVETGDDAGGGGGGGGEVTGALDDTFNFASRTRNGRRTAGPRYFADVRADDGGGGGGAGAEGRQSLRLVPHAAAELNCWKADHTAESLSCSLLSSVQLSAVVVRDHGEPTLRVAVVSRRFGVALATFPVVGRRGVARVSTSLLPVKVSVHRRWEELGGVAAAETETERTRRDSVDGSALSPLRGGGGGGGGGYGVPAPSRGGVSAVEVDDVRHSPLLRRYRAWADTVVCPSTTYASVPLLQWVQPPAWPEETEENRVPADPVLLLQRSRALLVLHSSGAAAPVCDSLLHCPPLHVGRHQRGSGDDLALHCGSYAGPVARHRLLRQLQLQHAPLSDLAVPPQAATAGKASWFKKFVRHAQSSAAARRRVAERPQLAEWWRRVYAPAADDLAYAGADAAVASDVTAALERVSGVGATHVADVVDVDVTQPLRMAVLAAQAITACRGMQQLVSSEGILTATLRQSLAHITAAVKQLNGGEVRADGEHHHSHIDSAAAAAAAAPPSLRESWAAAEALAQLPLSCATRALAQEVVHIAADAANAGPAATTAATGPMVVVRRWWWLAVRSCSVVVAVNERQADAARRELGAVLAAVPIHSVGVEPTPASSSPPLARRAGDVEVEEAVVDLVARALLFCPPQLMPNAIPLWLQLADSPSSAPSQQQQQQARSLRAAVAVALEALGGNAADAGAEDVKAAAAVSSLAARFTTVRIDGAHWTHAVYYTNVLGHLRHLANGSSAGVAAPVRACAAECVGGVDAAVEAAATAVLDVATQTTAVLLGAVVDVPAASRSRMAAAVAQSTSKRQLALHHGAGGHARGDGPPRLRRSDLTSRGAVDGDGAAVFLLRERSPVDVLGHRLHEAQWRDLYGAVAYPTNFFFAPARSSTQGGYAAADLPCQLLTAPPASAPATTHADAVGDASESSGRRGRVKEVLLTERTPVGAAAAVVPPPTMELVPEPPTPLSAAQRGTRPGSNGGTAPQQQQQSSPLSLRAAVAQQEADLHKTYFDAFAAAPPDAGEGGPAAAAAVASGTGPSKESQLQPSATGAGYDLRADAVLQQMQERLHAGEAEEVVTASTTRRRQQQQEARQRVPGPAAFAPSTTRRAVHHSADDAAAVHATPTQSDYFTRFAADD